MRAMTAKILIVGPAWVGDMVMAQSLFKLIKKRDPAAIIDVLAPAWSLPILERMPEVSEGIVMPIGHGKLNLRQRYQIGKSLRARKYTHSMVLPNSFKSALIPFFANIPVRTGWSRELRGLILNDVRRLDEKRYPLMIERFMALGLAPKAILGGEFPLPALQYTEATQAIALARLQLKRSLNQLLILCPGAEFGPAKRWPEEYYADIARAKLAEGWDVWILGSPKDSVAAETIMTLTENRCVNLTGKTLLVEAIDLLSMATMVVSNDSGLMHIAAAVNKPLVAIYGPTSTTFTPPLHARARVLQLTLECQPCFQRECPLQHQRCMRELKPAQVLQVMSEFA
jgi:heptosyltransferase-2